MTLQEAMAAAVTDSWLGYDQYNLNAALESKNGGIGPAQQAQVYLNAGNPNGKIFVNSTDIAVCFDYVNTVMWSKVDGTLGSSGWNTTTAFFAGGGGGFYA